MYCGDKTQSLPSKRELWSCWSKGKCWVIGRWSSMLTRRCKMMRRTKTLSSYWWLRIVWRWRSRIKKDSCRRLIRGGALLSKHLGLSYMWCPGVQGRTWVSVRRHLHLSLLSLAKSRRACWRSTCTTVKTAIHNYKCMRCSSRYRYRPHRRHQPILTWTRW